MRPITKVLLVAACVVATLLMIVFSVELSPNQSEGAIEETYSLAGPVIHVMILDQSKVVSGDDLPRLARDYCAHREVNGCFVWMYFDRKVAPREGKGGDTAKKAPVFVYTSNWNTDYESRLWNCGIYPQSDERRCLAPEGFTDSAP